MEDSERDSFDIHDLELFLKIKKSKLSIFGEYHNTNEVSCVN